MKYFIFSLLVTAGIFSFVSCERHSWEDSSEGAKDGTKNLFPKSEKKSDHKDHKSSDEEPGH
ncbi:MAG: hypothetical protein P8P36_04980 [Akkermansiaceae bacterium]|nr:hypothetical protein [Akkermansiaceae bacterium]